MSHTMELNQDGEARGPPPDPLLGRLLLHYRVLEVIGQGGMSVVYRGRDEHLARDVAIKVLHPFLREKAECRMRLAREARAVARLEHPHIVKVFDFSGDRPTLNEKKGEDDEKEAARVFPSEGFIVAELVKGPTLKRHAEKNALWRVPEVGALAVWQLALALQHAHDNGVVHRDLKPENVMVRDDGVLKLMDFGIAQVRDQSGLTITGTLLGSPAHMAPECIDGHAADERSDIFSLGTVLYWIATGSLPFEALTPHALLKLIVDGKMTPAQQKSPRVSDELGKVIAKALATKPEERFATAREFAAALEDVVERSGLHADPVLLRTTLGKPADEIPACAARVRAAFLERAQKSLDEGATARALSALNRVLADDPADKDARALLDRLDADDADLGGDLSSVAKTDPARPLPPELLPTAPTLSMSRARWQRLVVGGAAVALVVAAVAIAQAVDEVAVPPDTDHPKKLVETPPPVEYGTSAGTPAAFDAPLIIDDDKDRKKRNPRIARVALPVLSAPEEQKDTVAAPAPPPPAAPTRPVTFKLFSWANIYVDGVLAAENDGFKPSTLQLTVGEHVVAYRDNEAAKDFEERIVVLPSGPPMMREVKRDPRPALLEVRCEAHPTATVTIGDDPNAAATPVGDTLERPLLVPLESSRATMEVYVYKKGFLPLRKKVTFEAGKKVQLPVVLEAEPVDAAATPEPKKEAPPG